MKENIKMLVNAGIMLFEHDTAIKVAVYWPDASPMWSGHVGLDALWAIALFLYGPRHQRDHLGKSDK